MVPSVGEKYRADGVEGVVLRVKRVPGGHRVYLRTAPGVQRVVSIAAGGGESQPVAQPVDAEPEE